MSGQVWNTSALGGYMWSPNLSRKLRTALQPMVRFRQFCDAKKKRSVWVSATRSTGTSTATCSRLAASWSKRRSCRKPISSSRRLLRRSSRYGNSVPFTKKLDDLSEHPVTEIIHKVLKNDARKVLDSAAYTQFNASPIRLTSTSASAYTVTTNGTASGTATTALSNTHVKAIADYMAEQNIPAFDGVKLSVGLPSDRDPRLQEQLGTIHQYTPEGWHVIMNGERDAMKASVSSSRPTSLRRAG